MYQPAYTETKDSLAIQKLLLQYPFATLISVTKNSESFVSHLPVHCVFKEDQLVSIEGHMALSNPHTQIGKDNSDIKIIFHGPHAYVSPLWYKSGRDVPTWNYAVVHVTGKITFSNDFKEICRNLVDLTKDFESSDNGWKFQLPDDLKAPEQLCSVITAFQIQPTHIQAKFKLAQSRPVIDRESVIENLASSSDQVSQEVAALMREALLKK